MSRAEKLEQAKTAIENSRTALTEKTKTDQSQLKLSGFPEVIESIKTGTKFTLNITCEAKDGTVLTATNGEEQVTGEVHSNQCVLEVYSTGEWNVEAKTGQSCTITIPEVYNEKAITPTVYGVKIIEDEPDPSNRVVYIDDSVGMQPVTIDQETGMADYHGWDKTWIFDKFKPCMLKTNGEIDYYLNPNDYSQKLDGGESDVANIYYEGNAMVCIEKFYTKFSMEDGNEVIEISEKPKEGFEAIGFIQEDGSETDKIFTSLYLCRGNTGSRLRSISNREFQSCMAYSKYMEAAELLGENYTISSWIIHQIINNIYLILMKTTETRNVIGRGRYASMKGKTGVCDKLGAIGCDINTHAIKFMHIEDFLSYDSSSGSSNSYYLSGIVFSNGKLYVKTAPPYDITQLDNFTIVDDYQDVYSWIKTMMCSNKYGRLLKSGGGSKTEYETAYWNNYSGTDKNIGMKTAQAGLFGIANSSADLSFQNCFAYLSYFPSA